MPEIAQWTVSDCADPAARVIADRHYNRQKVGAVHFVPPGFSVVLLSRCRRALWVTLWQKYVQHAWPGAWVNSCFRNEGAGLSSDLIRDAVAVTRYVYGTPPPLGMISFVDASQVRHKRDPGRCFKRAGFSHVGFTQAGLFVFQQLPAAMPEPLAPFDAQLSLSFS